MPLPTRLYHIRKVINVSSNHDSTHLIVTTTEGLFGCENANKQNPEWKELIDGEFYDVILHPEDSNIIYASRSDTTGIFKYDLTTKIATHIFDIDTVVLPYDELEFPKLRRISIKITQAVPDTSFLFALLSIRDGDYTLIYRYNMVTEKWHKFNGGNFPNGYARKLGWAIRPALNDSNQIQILGQNANPLKVFYNGRSNDNISKVNRVRDYNSTDVHDDFHYLFFEDDSTLWAGTDGGVSMGRLVSDTLIEWTPKSNGLGVATIEFIDAKYGYVTSGQFDCGSNIYRSENEINWADTMKVGGDGFQTIITGSDTYYMSRENGNISFFDGNSNPVPINMDKCERCDPPVDTVDCANFATYYVKLGDNFYAAGQSEIMKYTYASGSWDWIKWSNLENLIGCKISGTWRIDATMASDGVTHQIYASAYDEPGPYQHIFKSIDGGGQYGNKWVRVEATPDSGWISALETTTNPDIILVGIKHKIYSVNTVNPASPTWSDITYNLSGGVINSIYRDGTTIWLGTEFGVYYLANGETSWVNYSSDLPNCEVKDIKVNNRRVYAGTYGRGVWFASAPGCGNLSDDLVFDFDKTITAAQDKKYYRNIVVDSGYTFTILGKVRMATGCTIVVERGAKLVVDGGTITKACPDLWEGVEVRGSSNSLQDTLRQGWVILKNGATIEYAKEAIATIKYDTTFADMTYAGGVIQADSAYFKNNKTDVVFFPYPEAYPTFPLMNNKSYFKNSVFVTDSNYYYFSTDAVIHVSLNDVLGVLFENSIFANTANESLATDANRGIGISAWDAGFLVKNTNQTTGNVFSELYYGIKSYAYTNSNRLIDIDGNNFQHNQTGCYLAAQYNANVTQNTFNTTPADSGFLHSYSGLYLDACTGFTIEENEFFSNYDPDEDKTTYTRSYGLVVNNSGYDDNEIYNNRFYNISWATQAQGINRSKTEGSGLTIKCNDYVENYQDISVVADYQGDQYGIREEQGSGLNSPEAPAGNTFSHVNSDNSVSDYSNTCADITYWHHRPNIPPAGTYLVPLYSTSHPKITKTLNPYNITYSKSTACPSDIETRSKSTIKAGIVTSKNYENLFADSLDILVDDGNTTALNLDVSTSIPPETMELRDELLDASPYLSDTVMVNAAKKEDVLPNSIITEVLTANPQSAKSEKVLDKLDERDNPPNENQMGQILANDTVIGHKESLESKRAYYTGQKARSVYELTYYFMRDTTLTAVHDSIAVGLANINSPTSRHLQAFSYLNVNDSTEVVNLMNSIPTEFDLDDTESDYHDYFVDYMEVMFAWKKQKALDSTQIVEVYDVMDNTDGLLLAYARNLLIMTDGLVYNEPYLLPDTSSNKSTLVKENVYSQLWDEESYFKLYPNPANGYITLEYKLDQAVARPVVEIVSVDGVHINTFRLFSRSGIKIIDLRDWTSGTYLLRLIENGKTLQNEKFIKY